MKHLLLSLSAAALLASCASDKDQSWSSECEANYSLNERENKACLDKVKKGAKTDFPANAVSLDPNPQHPHDSLGRNKGTDDTRPR